MTSDFFQGIMRWNVEKNGATELLPYFYYDIFSMAAVYTASTAKVRDLLPHTDLFPIELTPGRCLVAFAAFEYRKTDKTSYNEVNISFLVSHRRRPYPLLTVARALSSRIIPSYVWQLPVTTEHARASGVDLFGYPKFVADIEFSRNQGRVECTLSDSGSDILRITGRILPTKRGKSVRYLTYAIDDGVLVSANLLVNQQEFVESWRKKDVVLQVGQEHPICHALDGIRLAKHPLLYRFIPQGEAILFPGRNVRDA
jgi:hypothetical protein